MNIESYPADAMFGELRSACAGEDYDRAHHCIRWFLLYAPHEQALSALHYAIKTTRLNTRNTYRWDWWLDFLEKGRRASTLLNNRHYFRIIPPDPSRLNIASPE